MRSFLASALCLAMLTTACKQTAPAITKLDGTYTGTFQRQQGGTGPVSQVSLVFSGNSWQGSSQTPKYPALCNGTYTISAGNAITFTNACFWTAEFDWSLILNRDYVLKISGNEVEITKSSGGYTDVYKLRK